jgi:hypothetical protein
MNMDLSLHEENLTGTSAWQLVKAHLDKKKSEIVEQILYYPPPIPACDAQYNYLLAERDRFAQALGVLGDWAEEEPLATFLARALDEETAVEIQTLLATV